VLIGALTAGLLQFQASAHAAEAPKRPPVSYTKEVAPFFRSKCITCHSGSQPQGGLSLETPETVTKGGRQGALFVAKKPEKSLLWLYLTAARQPKMPPNEKVDESQTAMIRRWIAEGAVFDVKKDREKQPGEKQPDKG
jgi:hypothetical protein